MTDKPSNEYKIIIDKAKKIIDQSDKEVFTDSGTLRGNRKSLEGLHKNINVLQHNNTFTLEHESGSKGVKRQFRQAAKKVVSSALMPAMKQQSLYNETSTKSILSLTKLTQELVEQSYRNKFYTSSQVGFIKDSVDTIAGRMDRMEQMLEDMQKRGQGTAGSKQSYAPAGEDIIIDEILRHFDVDYRLVTYLDIGSNHAIENSFTYHAYLQGAEGVVIEANPSLIGRLRKARQGDIVINCIAAHSNSRQTLYVFNDGSSTANLAVARHISETDPELYIESETKVEARDIDQIVADSYHGTPAILAVNTSGGEYELLKEWDFDTHRPLIVIAPIKKRHPHLFEGEQEKDLQQLMSSKNYIEYASTGSIGLFVDAERDGIEA